jgi:hypothetical protein
MQAENPERQGSGMLTVLTILAISWCALVAFAMALARSSGRAEELRSAWRNGAATPQRGERFRRQEGDVERKPQRGVGHVPA